MYNNQDHYFYVLHGFCWKTIHHAGNGNFVAIKTIKIPKFTGSRIASQSLVLDGLIYDGLCPNVVIAWVAIVF